MRRILLSIFVLISVLLSTAVAFAGGEKVFRAGAARVDITPTVFPVLVDGGFHPMVVSEVLDPLYVRCLMLHDGTEQIVLVVIDCCVFPQNHAESVKRLIVEKTGVPKDRITISSTHCHSAPGTRPHSASPNNEKYIALLHEKIPEAVVEAKRNLVPAKIGWAVGNDPNNVYGRRFLMKPGTATTNPFGGTVNDRVQMNPGVKNSNKIARTGPVDTAVSVISVTTKDGRPLAVWANYSTHYAGVKSGVLSGDYFGVFAGEMQRRIAETVGADKMPEHFVAMMTNGTSGDANCIDFLNPDRKFTYKTVGTETAAAAMAVWPNIEYHDWVPLGMKEKRIPIDCRLPTPEEVAAAKEHIAKLSDGKAKTIPDVYAFRTVSMADFPESVDVVVQAMRIGELGMTALPAEVYGITGLEIKARSPLTPTVNIGLANGSFGYIPPPEQHRLGGYNTWRTTTGGLAVDAEPKIKATALELLNSMQ